MYLLDTDIIIYALKGIPSVLVHLESHRNDPMSLSAATLMELYYGAYKSQKVRAFWPNRGLKIGELGRI